jgi:2-polyprenyl-6-hydroxyphenyl methylase/3-demethylubiquinone-9 3-methyltransferase
MNPVRLQFIRDHIATTFGRDCTASAPLSGLKLLDIGSGGGLVCEPLARLGASVTGVDAAEKNIHVATLHAEQMGLDIAYRHSTAEALAAHGEQYDVVLALEIVEHVADVEAFLASVAALVKPNGLLFMSTLNRTAQSYATAIIGAEYVLRWLPKGTHHWKKFLKPSELILPLERHGIRTRDMQGMVYDPWNASWSLNPQKLNINYIFCGEKPS